MIVDCSGDSGERGQFALRFQIRNSQSVARRTEPSHVETAGWIILNTMVSAVRILRRMTLTIGQDFLPNHPRMGSSSNPAGSGHNPVTVLVPLSTFSPKRLNR